MPSERNLNAEANSQNIQSLVGMSAQPASYSQRPMSESAQFIKQMITDSYMSGS